MAQTKVIQRRIRSVKNAKQITKALEVVAASRMRQVVARVEGARAYANAAAGVMQRLSHEPEAGLHPFFQQPDAKAPSLYIIFTSDRGQAGAFNSNIFNLALTQIRQESVKPQVVVIGRKGARFFARLGGIDFRGEYQDLADVPEVNVFAPLTEMIEQGITENNFGTVHLIYTRFLSSLTQQASVTQLLPIKTIESGDTPAPKDVVYETEPELSNVIAEGTRLYFESRLMKAKIESAASEHAMRMVAMGNANRNASDLIDDLILELNATRQAAITQEIAEITGGAEAISQ